MDLRPYRHLYRSSPSAKSIAREYLGLHSDEVIPLSISHGVDFGHETRPQDSLACEPIHWCYNRRIQHHLNGLKPHMLLPHPWWMLHAMHASPTPVNDGTLLIGPPPSKTNDERLWQSIQRQGFSPDAILIKERRGAKSSADFWSAHGVEPVTAGSFAGGHYNRLYSLLRRYGRIALPVFSSVGVFAAAMGIPVRLVLGYSHCSYSPRGLDLRPLVQSPVAQQLVRLFASERDADAGRLARELLGADLARGSRQGRRQEFLWAVHNLQAPLFVPAARGSHVIAWGMTRLAIRLGRTDFLRYGLCTALRYKLSGTSRDVVWKRVDMIDALRRGSLTRENFQSRRLRSDERGVSSGMGADESSEPYQ